MAFDPLEQFRRTAAPYLAEPLAVRERLAIVDFFGCRGGPELLGSWTAVGRVHGDDGEMYRYWKRRRSFADETLEGQAEMLGNYSSVRDSRNPALTAKRNSLRRRLAGSGVDGL